MEWDDNDMELRRFTLILGFTAAVFSSVVFTQKVWAQSAGITNVVYTNVSGTPTFTANAGVTNFDITLTGNVSSSTFAETGGATGVTYGSFKICQDATGSRTFVFPTGSLGFGTIESTASKCSTQAWKFDGSVLRAIGMMSTDDTPGPTGATGPTGPTGPAGSSPPFNSISSGTNTTAAMLVGTGASLGPTGSGTLSANQVNGSTVSGTNGNIVDFGASNVLADSGKALSNVVKRGIGFTMGDVTNSGALTTSNVSYLTVPFACTISAYNLAIDAGTITVKFWKVATGTAIPTSGNSISTSGVGVASGTAIHSTTVSDFTSTAVSANDIMAMAVTAVATAKFVNAVLECDQ